MTPESKMLKRILYSLMLGLAITALSLFYKTGTPTYEPMPYIHSPGNSIHPILNGVVVNIAPNPLAGRGFPFPVVSIYPDGGGTDLGYGYDNSLYRGLSLSAIFGDWVIYTIVAFAALWVVYGNPEKTKPKKQ